MTNIITRAEALVCYLDSIVNSLSNASTADELDELIFYANALCDAEAHLATIKEEFWP